MTETASPATSTEQRQCPRCHEDLSYLLATARFCPQCGSSLYTDNSRPAPEAQSPAMPPGVCGWFDRMRQYAILMGILDPDLPPSPMYQDRSVMIRGYGNALYRLGEKYEAGLGAAANRDEALRCYGKAARLGNSLAKARIGE
ncbi:MAG TPA: SEL1-like repeat protein [Tepidisphaeraceae bacterium]|jgi:TPR repeat protein